MKELKQKIIEEIIKRLSPLSTLYKEEITNIINDLSNNNYTSLENFINKHYQEISFSDEFKIFVTHLVKYEILPDTYLDFIKPQIYSYTITNINDDNFKLINSKPINLKKETYYKITGKTSLETNNDDEDEILSLESDKIKKIREKMLEVQVNYLNNATEFIQKLDEMNPEGIYNTLLILNDIRFIQHSISKLSLETLNNLLSFIEEKLKENNHNSINIFLEEAIKKNLHSKKEKM